jgi:hypothetical protein
MDRTVGATNLLHNREMVVVLEFMGLTIRPCWRQASEIAPLSQNSGTRRTDSKHQRRQFFGDKSPGYSGDLTTEAKVGAIDSRIGPRS